MNVELTLYYMYQRLLWAKNVLAFEGHLTDPALPTEVLEAMLNLQDAVKSATAVVNAEMAKSGDKRLI